MLDAKLLLAFALGALGGAAAGGCESGRGKERPSTQNDSPDAGDPARKCTEGDAEPAGDGCNTCTCLRGDWVCTLQRCPPHPPVPDDACDGCLTGASSGNFAQAAQQSSRCTDAAKKKQCLAIVKKSAPAAAKAAAFNNQCGAAKAIVAAAQGMGAGSSALKSAVKTCQ